MGSVKQLCDDFDVLFGMKAGTAYRFFRKCVHEGLAASLSGSHRGPDFQDIAVLLIGLAQHGSTNERMDAIRRALEMTPQPVVGDNPFAALDPLANAHCFLHAMSILPLSAWLTISQSFQNCFPDDVPEAAKELATQSWMDGQGMHNIVVQIWRNRARIMLTENGNPIWEARYMANTEAGIINTAPPQGSDLVTMVQFGIPTLQAALHAFEDIADDKWWTEIEKEIA